MSAIGSQYTAVNFEPGKAELTKEDRRMVKELIRKAHQNVKRIEEIRILAWSDHEYPESQAYKAAQKDVLLATQRGEKIRDYLQDVLKETEDIDSFNMARRPDFLSKLLQNDEYKVKKAFEVTGPTSTRLPDGSLSYTKASKALVIIDYEGD